MSTICSPPQAGRGWICTVGFGDMTPRFPARSSEIICQPSLNCFGFQDRFLPSGRQIESWMFKLTNCIGPQKQNFLNARCSSGA